MVSSPASGVTPRQGGEPLALVFFLGSVLGILFSIPGRKRPGSSAPPPAGSALTVLAAPPREAAPRPARCHRYVLCVVRVTQARFIGPFFCVHWLGGGTALPPEVRTFPVVLGGRR